MRTASMKAILAAFLASSAFVLLVTSLSSQEPSVLDEPLRALADKDYAVRRYGARRLAFLARHAKGEPPERMAWLAKAAPSLRLALDDPFPDIRASAAEALVIIEPGNPKNADGIARLLTEKTDDAFCMIAKRFVVSELLTLGPSAGPHAASFRVLLKDQDAELALSAAIALARLEPPQKDGLSLLTDALKSPSAEVLQALGRLGGDAKEAVPVLRKLSRDGWLEAAEALAGIDADPTFAVTVLCGYLLDTNVRFRFQQGLAASRRVALLMVSPLFSSRALRFFPQILWGEVQSASMIIGDSRNSERRRKAAIALGKLGAKAKDAVPFLEFVMQDPKLHDVAAEALLRIRGER